MDDRSGFVDLFEAEYGPLHRVAFLIVGDDGVAHELVQEAFTRAFARWRRLACYDKPGAWLRTVVVRLALRARDERRVETSGAPVEAGQEDPVGHDDLLALEQAKVGSPGHSLGHWSDGATRGIEVESPGSVPAGDRLPDQTRFVLVADEYSGTAAPNVFHTPDPWRVMFEWGDDPACQDWTLIAVNVSVDELVAAARSLEIRLR